MKSADNQPPPKELPPFVHSQGPSPRAQLAKGPLEVFQLFFTTVIFGSIVEQTKSFALQKGKKLDLCVEELMAFFRDKHCDGNDASTDYWSMNKILATPWFPAIMARDRFYNLLRYLHLVNSTLKKREQGYDPLFKVMFLVDHLAAVYSQYYYPSRHLSIDEMMVGTRCRV